MTTAAVAEPVALTPEECHKIFPHTLYRYDWHDEDPPKQVGDLVMWFNDHGGILEAYRTMLQRLPAKVLARAFFTQMTHLYPESDSNWGQMAGDLGEDWTVTVLVATANAKCRQPMEVDGIPAYIIELWAPLFRDLITLLRKNNVI